MAAVSVIFMWFKVIEWLRLYEKPAFFIGLIKETIYSLRYFLMILFILYIMLVSAIYFITLSLPSDQEIIHGDFGLGLYEAFLR